ncbi:hypothetical protein [Leptospira haakeii]|uniref:hypothetical protein n=1 Tax=Leptospira haakeii TaxID=2023198 RepID=UPI000F640E1D|nr:hypothetical protein [Leptospira haakeii]
MKKISFYLLFTGILCLAFNGYLAAENTKIFGSGKRMTSNLRSAILTENVPEVIRKKYGNAKVYSLDLERFQHVVLIRKPLNKGVCYYNLENKLDLCSADPVLADGFKYFWYLDLKKDSLIYIFEFFGDEDYSDYKLTYLNTQTMKQKVLFYVAPIIKKEKNLHWGYPWDIVDIILSRKENDLLLNATFKHKIDVSEAGDYLDKTAKIPAIFFTGVPTQETDMKSEVQETKSFFTVESLSRIARNVKSP